MLQRKRRELGFTLTELLVVIATIATLMTLAIPSYLQFLRLQRLGVAREQIHRALQEAQRNAKRDKVVWQASFRNAPHAQWVVHQRLPGGSNLNSLAWQDLDRDIIIIDGKDQNETTFYQHSSGVNEGIWREQFNHHGHPHGQLGRITIGFQDSDPKNKRRPLRCVVVSTLLGAMRTAHERPTKQEGRYCY